MAARLFVNYRRSHKAEVLAARAALEAAGVDVWLDLEDIDPLADFPTRIREGIDASHAMLVWWSADYAESDICLQELRRAWQHARRISSDVARRVWVLNPEAGGGHIFAGELNASNFLTPPQPGQEAARAESLRHRLASLLPEGPLADERRAEPLPRRPPQGRPGSSDEPSGMARRARRSHPGCRPTHDSRLCPQDRRPRPRPRPLPLSPQPQGAPPCPPRRASSSPLPRNPRKAVTSRRP